MKINPVNTTSFQGHGAGRIKALYMQNANLPAQIPVYNELKRIGREHGFDVFIQNQDKLISNSMKYPSPQHCDYQLWSQDNKTILHKNGETIILSGLYMPQSEQRAAQALADIKNIKHEKAELFLEGGNFFVGKKPDGKNYLIIGWKDIEYSAIHFYLKNKLGTVTYDEMNTFIGTGELDKNGKTIANYQEFNDEITTWTEFVISGLQKSFDTDKKDITIISQGQYHNDLVVRPLNYPYVLVNDEKMSYENIQKLRKKFKFDLGTMHFAKVIENKLKEQNKEYATCDNICSQLEKKGFVPVRIGGCYGVQTINFINAIVHKNGDDLVYITNSGESKDKNYEFLQTLFEQDLKEKCPQIRKIHFVKGEITNKKSNIVLEYLKKYKGGIHCLCCEEMSEFHK